MKYILEVPYNVRYDDIWNALRSITNDMAGFKLSAMDGTDDKRK